jgi:hypothetical protein
MAPANYAVDYPRGPLVGLGGLDPWGSHRADPFDT